MKQPKLKKCPFCGHKAKLFQDMYSYYIVQCKHCGIGTLHVLDKQQCIDEWNNRFKKVKNNERNQ